MSTRTAIRIEGYDEFEPLALGGMAAVYRARRTSVGRPVAIKVLYPHLAADPRYLERFRKEARAAAQLQHDNIVNVIDTGESDGQHYIVMEFADGLTVEHLLADGDPLPSDVALAIAMQVASGLDAAHRHGLVHRDVKPANIIVTREGSVKIADFGLARMVADEARHTLDGEVMGTPAYMSPEQTRGEDTGAVSDVFSLGVVCYEMLTGRRPFVGASVAEVVTAVQTADPDPPSSLVPELDAHLDGLVAMMMERDPAARLESAAAALEAIREVAEAHGWRCDRERVREYVLSLPQDVVERARARTWSGPMPAAAEPPDEVAAPSVHPVEAQARRAASEAGLDDPESVDWFVWLDSLGPDAGGPAAFAVRLSMRTKMPLPRARVIVSGMPSRVGGAMPWSRALKLGRTLHKLGARVRLEPQAPERPAREAASGARVSPDSRTADARRQRGDESARGASEAGRDRSHDDRSHDASRADGEAARGGSDRRTRAGNAGASGAARDERRGREFRRPGSGATHRTPTRFAEGIQICPSCGWEEDRDAKFCSVCGHRFTPTESIDLRVLQERQAELAREMGEGGEDGASTSFRFSDLPMSMRVALGVGVGLLLLLILLGR